MAAAAKSALIYKSMIKADGSLISYGWPDGMGRMFAIALGEDETTVLVATSSAESELVNHRIVSGQATLPYFTAEQNWADETERTTNCLAAELKIEGSQGARRSSSRVPFISGGSPHACKAAALSPVREAGTPFMYPGASVAVQVFSGAPGAQGKATSSELMKFAVTIKNTFDESIQTTALNRTDVVWETVDFNIDGTLKYTDRNISGTASAATTVARTSRSSSPPAASTSTPHSPPLRPCRCTCSPRSSCSAASK